MTLRRWVAAGLTLGVLVGFLWALLRPRRYLTGCSADDSRRWRVPSDLYSVDPQGTVAGAENGSPDGAPAEEEEPADGDPADGQGAGTNTCGESADGQGAVDNGAVGEGVGGRARFRGIGRQRSVEHRVGTG